MATLTDDRKQYVSYTDIATVSHRIHGLGFRAYSDEEVKRLSLKVINQLETFDCLGHATSGGLYDLELGPQRVEGPCVTCGLNMQDALPLHRYMCPGHFGHIQLPMPVFSPVLLRELIQILRIMCFKCHRLRIKPDRTILFTCQMEALEEGLLTAVFEMQGMHAELIKNQDVTSNGASSSNENSDEYSLEALQKQLLAIHLAARRDMGNEAGKKSCETKCLLALRQSLIKDFLSSCESTTQCSHCHQPRLKIKQENFCKVYFERSSKAQKAAFECIESEPNSDDLLPKSRQQFHPHVIRTHLRKLWNNEKKVLRFVNASVNVHDDNPHPTDVFFKLVQIVPPTRFRQVVDRNAYKIIHPETDGLLQVMKEAHKLRNLLKDVNASNTDTNKVKVLESLEMVGQSLQGRVNSIFDCRLGKMFVDAKPAAGVVQLLEHKSGLLRWNMMGKRVDFAARSVISPDPCIATNEVGIPLYFAKRLTYPEPVTPHNVSYLRRAIINGPDIYPGASHIIFANGEKKILDRRDINKRKAAAKQLLIPFATSDSSLLSTKVLRHIKNGDILLMNRQPSLHRPSMQAHKARILPHLVEEKTLRMHYSNCKAYNADFDGDEMNAHFPQNELARSECYSLASTDHQYLVPKDGTPLAGLIQDYMVSGVWLTIRGQFFNRRDYEQLVYTALVDSQQRIRLLKPAIVKPECLWSGKQVVSTVLINLIPDGKPALTLIGKANIPEKKWVQTKPRSGCSRTQLHGNNMTESEVVILNGHLLVGVLDKAHYGASPYGLVHSCYELYGGQTAGKLLTCLARLFNWFLQFRGFTMGVEDIMVKKSGNDKRRDLLAACEVCGPEAAILAFGLPDSCKISQVESIWRKTSFSKGGLELLQRLDCIMNKKTNDCQDCIKKLIMPEQDLHMPGELLKVFPHNNLQMMFLSGAKGTQVNCAQISCALGQISLEGRRPPLMLNGASLPSFKPYDVSPRAGGFVAGRFLTGLRPQEYFFHCMAGREGLVDTAVKTSHSGYLQRCLIKHLEGLTVSYDMTVRDSDGSVIQFFYGEDGMDVMKTAFLRRQKSSDRFPPFAFMVSNRSIVANKTEMSELKKRANYNAVCIAKEKEGQLVKGREEECRKSSRTSPFIKFCASKDEFVNADKNSLVNKWYKLSEHKKEKFMRKCAKTGDPMNSCLRPDCNFGSVSESLDALVQSYTSSNPDKVLIDDTVSERKQSHRRKTAKFSSSSSVGQPMPVSEFSDLIYYKSLRALVPPGDAVGLLAAQSIGEPSTQMTLNTFHFAGHQAMNVTLGIPRLREILMTASKTIKTPIMEVPVLDSPACSAEAQQIAKRLTRVLLTAVLKKVSVESRIGFDKLSNQRYYFYDIHFDFHKSKHYREWTTLNAAKILSFMERKFFRVLSSAIERTIREMSQATLLHSAKVREKKVSSEVNNEETDEKMNLNDENIECDDDDNDDDPEEEENNFDCDDQDEDQNSPSRSSESCSENDDLDAPESRVVASDIDEEAQLDMLTAHSPPPAEKTKRPDFVRIANVKKLPSVVDYTYDARKQLWCKVTYRYSLTEKAIDIKSVIEAEAARSVIVQTPGIKQAVASKRKEDKHMMLRTEGVNIHEMYNYAETLDLNRIYSNSVYAMAQHYGIEAAYQAIIKEISTVFELYKITVDRRHLSLIADYMTFEGCYKPFNRQSMTTNPSPLQNMSFETTMRFLRGALIEGTNDDITSPSARIVTGRVMKSGTGFFDVLIPLNV